VHWTRQDVLSSGLFYALLPGVLAPPFIVTAVFFNQVELVAGKGWDLAWFAAWFPLLAALHVVSSLLTGWLIDLMGARRLLPFMLLPLGVGVLLLAAIDSRWILPAAVALIGVTIGCSAAVSGALWAELYGTLHLGAIRAMVAGAVVLASAIAPGLVGVLLDAGISLDAQFLFLSGYCLAASAWMSLLRDGLERIVRPADRACG
jgi:MFS family permease